MYYFTYGSNLNRKQLAERCSDSKPLFKATLHDHKLIFAGWSRSWDGSVASIEPSPGASVVGGLCEISERDRDSLDGCEGYPAIYDRIHVEVETEDGNQVEAMTYIKVDRSQQSQPSQQYLAIIRSGYEDWGLEWTLE